MRIIKATPYPPVETQVRTLPGASSRPPNWMLWVNSAQAKLGHFCNKMLWDEHVFMVFWQLFKFRDVSINQSRDGETRALDTEAYHSFGEMRNQADTALLTLEQLRAKCLRCKSMRLEVTCIFLQFRKPTYHGRSLQEHTNDQTAFCHHPRGQLASTVRVSVAGKLLGWVGEEESEIPFPT